MTAFALYTLLLVAATPPLGAYLHRVFTRQRTGRLETAMYRLIGVHPQAQHTSRQYASAVLWFSAISTVFVYLVMRAQQHLPLNPDHLPAVGQDVAFNTAISFMSNTSWQAYGGETTLSYLSQMLAITTQMFVSAVVGMAVLVAMIRGFTRSENGGLGNFWVDLVRATVYVLLPLSAVAAIAFVAQGIPQTLGGHATADAVQGFVQAIARGPVAGQTAIKQLSTDGGGFFNANSAHPFENPTAFTNLVESLLIILIPAALTYTFGKMVGSRRQGWALFAAMWILLAIGFAMTAPGERQATSAMHAAGIGAEAPNMEGKEARIGPDDSSVWAVVTTATSSGSVNSMHDSFQPLGQLAPMFNMAAGEVVFGGVGSGLYGMVFYVVIAVFIGGLMIGRTPEYLGKKIRAREVKLVVLGVLVPFLVVLALTAIAVVTKSTVAATTNAGPHGFSEIFYAFLSQGNNNGSAFAGLTASGPFYAVLGGVAMLVGRFVPLLAALALGGSVGEEKTVPPSLGTLRTDTGLFVGLLVSVVLVIGALTFLPALAIGPIVEHLSHGTLF